MKPAFSMPAAAFLGLALLFSAAPAARAGEPTGHEEAPLERLGPYQLSSPDGLSSLRIGFAGQLMLQLESPDPGPGGERETTFKPLLRRIRLTLGGTILSKRFKYYLQLSTAPGSLESMDYYLEGVLHPHARLRGGQWKIPFTFHRMGSFKTLTAADWSIVVPAFGAERQIGLAIHNEARGHALTYHFGVFTGINSRASHATGLAKKVWREPVPNPSNLLDPGPIDGFHPELVGQLAYNYGDIDKSTDTDWDGGPLRLATAISFAWDAEPEQLIDYGLRLAAELLIKAHGFSAFGVFYAGFARDGDALDLQPANLGGLIQASVLLCRAYEIAARWAIVDYAGQLTRDARAFAAAVQWSEPELAEQHADAGQIEREVEATLAFNWYIIGKSLKLQADASYLMQDRVGHTRHDARVRLQGQLTF